MIDRTRERNINAFLENSGQNYVDPNLRRFIDSVPSIKSIKDLKDLDRLVFSYMRHDNNPVLQREKFAKSASDIFARGTYSGCSDIGILFSSILREKGIPTVYIESAEASWLDDVRNGKDNGMRGHIFLELQLGNQSVLYDPSWHKVYNGYDRNNPNLPRGLIAFSKGLNPSDVGVSSIRDERNSALREIGNVSYTDPNYSFVDLREQRQRFRFTNLRIFNKSTNLNHNGLSNSYNNAGKNK